MALPVVQVDAFTDRAFAGNPAAVCILSEPGDEVWMQAVAREMNLSETAFLVERGDGWDLRWFTPTVEVDLCGHATVASAHVLWEDGRAERSRPLRFHTRSGPVTATGHGPWIELDLPAADCVATEDPLAEAAMGAPATHVGRGEGVYVIEVESEERLRVLAPDMGLVARLPAQVVYATALASTPGFDYVLRVFGPSVGIPEDPATGSAQCTLGPLWAARLGRQELMALQLSPRGGVLRVRVDGPRVLVAGQAITVLRGELLPGGGE